MSKELYELVARRRNGQIDLLDCLLTFEEAQRKCQYLIKEFKDYESDGTKYYIRRTMVPRNKRSKV